MGRVQPTSYCYGPIVLWRLLTHHLGGSHGDEEASGDDLLLRQGAGKSSRTLPNQGWTLRRRRNFSWMDEWVLRVFPRRGINRRRGGVGGGRRQPHVGQARPGAGPRLGGVWASLWPPGSLLLAVASLRDFKVFAICPVQFRETFMYKFLKPKTTENRNWHCGTGLIGQFQKILKKCRKTYINHIRINIKQAWSIKNYRCICNASTSPSLTPARPRVGK